MGEGLRRFAEAGRPQAKPPGGRFRRAEPAGPGEAGAGLRPVLSPFAGRAAAKKDPRGDPFFRMFYGCSSTSPKLMPSSRFRTISEISA